jgi:glycosyltransferase involved in cell wall biosynthesis
MPVVREILDGEKYAPFVTITGLVTQELAPAYLAASDILLSPHVDNADGSRFFGSPTKLFEYMAMGKAIVASNLGQIGQVLKPSISVDCLPIDYLSTPIKELALLANPGDVQGLIDGIRILTQTSLLRKNLGHNARQEALSKYTWNHHVSAILKSLYELGYVDKA